MREFEVRGGWFWIRCDRCGASLPSEELVEKRREGEAMELLCRPCAHAENERRNPKKRGRSSEEGDQLCLDRERWYDAWITRRREARLRTVYDSIPVLDARGAQIGLGSRRRIRQLERDGFLRVVERDQAGFPAKVQLTSPKEIEPREPIVYENRCVACGSGEFLSLWRFLPSWHPAGRDVRRNKTSAALCSRCYAVIHDRTRRLFEAIAGPPQEDPRFRELVRNRSILHEARAKIRQAIPLSDSMLKIIDRVTGLEIWMLLRDSGGAGFEKELLRSAKEMDLKLKALPNDVERVRRRVVESKIDLEVCFRLWAQDLAGKS